MHNRAPGFSKSDGVSISVTDLERYADGWLLTGEIDQHSSRTLEARRSILDKLLWFLRQKQYTCCSTLELRQFLAYVTNGHKEAGGRWGNAQQTKPVRPRTVHTYHGHLRTFFRWIVSEEGLDVSPRERPVPTSRADQVQRFTQDQIEALLLAAKQTKVSVSQSGDYLLSAGYGVARFGTLCAPVSGRGFPGAEMRSIGKRQQATHGLEPPARAGLTPMPLRGHIRWTES